jgi:hypothetical protein
MIDLRLQPVVEVIAIGISTLHVAPKGRLADHPMRLISHVLQRILGTQDRYDARMLAIGARCTRPALANGRN